MAVRNDSPLQKNKNWVYFVFVGLVGVICLLGLFIFDRTLQIHGNLIVFERPRSVQPTQGQAQKKEAQGQERKKEAEGNSFVSPARPFGMWPAPGPATGGF